MTDMHQGADDQQLISLVLEGRKEAYSILVSRYQNYVFTLTLRYISSREEAEEVAQDVFVKAYRNLAAFRGSSRFSTWLYTIVHTTCISRLRLRGHHLVTTDEETLAAISAQHSAHVIPAGLDNKSSKEMLDIAIKSLKPEDARIITLFYQAEQNLEEIARVLMIPANTVKVKLHRARQKLRDILVNRFPEEVADFNYSKNNL